MLSYKFPIDDISKQKAYDYTIIKEAFDYISHTAQIEYDFLQGGCQQRSHLISMILAKKFKIKHCKIWLFAPAVLYDDDNRALFVADNNQLSPDNIVSWNYHTAPAIKLGTKDDSSLLLLDPSLDRTQPLPLYDWLARIGNSSISKYTFLKPEKYFFNCKYNEYAQLTNVIDGTFIEFTNPAKDNLVLEKGLAVNDMAMVIYKKYIKPLMENPDSSNEKRLQDLKDIFGNAMVLDMLFAQNLGGTTDNTSYRYLLNNYKDIATEAIKLFHKRLLYWTEFTSKLL